MCLRLIAEIDARSILLVKNILQHHWIDWHGLAQVAQAYYQLCWPQNAGRPKPSRTPVLCHWEKLQHYPWAHAAFCKETKILQLRFCISLKYSVQDCIHSSSRTTVCEDVRCLAATLGISLWCSEGGYCKTRIFHVPFILWISQHGRLCENNGSRIC